MQVSDSGVADAFLRVVQMFVQRYKQRLPDDPFDFASFPVLRALDVHGPSRISDVGHLLFLDLSTVSRRVRQLEQDGLVDVVADEHDKRARQVRLTPTGRTTLDRFLGQRRALVTGLLADWPPEDRADLHRLLQRLGDDLAALPTTPPTRLEHSR